MANENCIVFIRNRIFKSASCCEEKYKICNSENIHENEFNFLTRGFSRMLSKNIMSPKVYEVSSAQGAPDLTTPLGVLR